MSQAGVDVQLRGFGVSLGDDDLHPRHDLHGRCRCPGRDDKGRAVGGQRAIRVALGVSRARPGAEPIAVGAVLGGRGLFRLGG